MSSVINNSSLLQGEPRSWLAVLMSISAGQESVSPPGPGIVSSAWWVAPHRLARGELGRGI